MTAKEYLMEIRGLEMIINEKIAKVKELEEIATSVGSFDYSKDKVQTSPSGDPPYMRQMEKIAELTKEITNECDRYGDIKAKIDAVVKKSISCDEYVIISKRYYDAESWKEIETETGWSARTVFRKHQTAINILNNVMIT